MTASILFLLPALALTVLPAHAQTMTFEEHRPVTLPAVAEFATSINRYMEVHRLLENPMSPTNLCADPEQAARARQAHRRAVVEARVATPRGDIFTPRVAAYMRHQFEIAADRASMTEADVTAVALERLPLLPMELEYRVIDRDLVILDTEIDLVVDVLPSALPPVKGSPCLAHPELEMCWS
jgi:hypothetical protein